MELRVLGTKNQGLLERSDGLIVVLLRELQIGAEFQSVGGRRIGVWRLVDFDERGFVLLLVDQEMDELGAGVVIPGIGGEVLLKGVIGFWLLLRGEALSQAKSGFGILGIDLQSVAESDFGVGGFLVTKKIPA